jgi:hypothetical protein
MLQPQVFQCIIFQSPWDVTLWNNINYAATISISWSQKWGNCDIVTAFYVTDNCWWGRDWPQTAGLEIIVSKQIMIYLSTQLTVICVVQFATPAIAALRHGVLTQPSPWRVVYSVSHVLQHGYDCDCTRITLIDSRAAPSTNTIECMLCKESKIARNSQQ